MTLLRRSCRLLPLLLGVALVSACASPDSTGAEEPLAIVATQDDGDGYHGAVLEQPYTLSDLSFTDTAGRSVELPADMSEPVTLVFFGYTHCPDVCNTVLADAASALRRLEAEVREDVQLLFVTTDPARDTPERMREYLDRFDPSFEGLTAPLPVIEQAAEELGVALSGTIDMPGGGYEVGHGAQVIGFGAEHAGRIVWTQPTPVGSLREDITRMVQST